MTEANGFDDGYVAEDDCGLISPSDGTRAVITRVSGRKGYYLVIESNGRHMVVARLHGVTESQQERSRRRMLAWAEGREIT